MASSMEGSMDTLHVENEALSAAGEMDKLETAEGKAVQMDPLEIPKEAAPKTDSGADCKVYSAEEHSSCRCSPSADGPAADTPPPGDAEMERPASPEPAVSATVGSTDPSEAPQERPSKISIAEMDCLICFNRYSAGRLPKLLVCQHAFCAVCLKLILCNEDQTWTITCPLCRKATLVFGGLVCSLRNKEDILGRLEDPNPGAEVPHPPDPPRLGPVDCRTDPQSPEEPPSDETGRVAAKRLVLLLLLVAMLIVLVLPFMYTGLLKWALCFVVALGLLMSGLLCCNPSWNCSGLRLPPWRRKETPVAAVA